jgi:flagellar protein FliO/FliZ
MTPGVSSLFWFVAVIALIPLVLWLVKRTPMGRAGASGAMRSVSVLPLSASQRIVTVEVGRGDSRCWLVLGVTGQTISTLHTMAPQDDVPSLSTLPPSVAPAPAAPATAFAQLLQRLQGGGPNAR